MSEPETPLPFDHTKFVLGTLFPITLLPALGLVVISASTMESELNIALSFLLRLKAPEMGALLELNQNFRPRIQLFQRLAKAAAGDDKKLAGKIDKLTKALFGVMEERHRIIHDQISMYSPSENAVGLARRDIWAVPRPFTMITEEGLVDLSNRMHELRARLQQYHTNREMWESGGEHFPWHGIRPDRRSSKDANKAKPK